ncbi:cellulose binding domain-containing protein [Micromonospora eburnea]|uniref:Cellulose binding domain-containing protein n=1 Tax=Micromonospora eburnea TaxID=227316 RepID=A0A1C6USM4_9ACTN|nr:cellulose binding domain-containing protein [Micromonospora eburnea]SCL57085.1 Cellulose binding domain-containing protein [Micromonospora eburnea]
MRFHFGATAGLAVLCGAVTALAALTVPAQAAPGAGVDPRPAAVAAPYPQAPDRAHRTSGGTDQTPQPMPGWDGWSHPSFGFSIKPGVTGAMGKYYVNPPGIVTPDFVYAPTLYPGSHSCIELYNNYHDGLELWVWDSCDVNPGLHKLATIDSTFQSKYMTNSEYRFRLVKTNAATNEWAASLYNVGTSAWDTVYTTHGLREGDQDGWAIFELYTNYNPTTTVGDYCTKTRGYVWRTSEIQVQINGSWVNLGSSNSNPMDPASIDEYGCPPLTTVRDSANQYTVTNPTLSCQVTYSASSWPNGFTANVTIKNTGTTPINKWALNWDFAGDQTITNTWNGVTTQTGQHVAVNNDASTATISPGSTVNFGFQASYTGTNTDPTAFTLTNGSPCNG